MESQRIELKVLISLGSETDEERLDEARHLLEEELVEIEALSLSRPPAKTAPQMTRSGEIFDIATLLLTFAASGGVFVQLTKLLQDWVTRDKNRRITLEIGNDRIDIKGPTRADQHKLIDELINRHTKASEHE